MRVHREVPGQESLPTAEDTKRIGLAGALPDDGESVTVVDDSRIALAGGGVRVDAELRSDPPGGSVEPLAEDAEARSVLAVAVPDHQKVSGAVHGDRRVALESRRVGIDRKLRPDLSS